MGYLESRISVVNDSTDVNWQSFLWSEIKILLSPLFIYGRNEIDTSFIEKAEAVIDVKMSINIL